jgi:integrase
MARARFLPKYVTRFTDRHGCDRLRYRRAGYVGGYFHAKLGTEEFRAEYAAFEASRVEEGPRQSKWQPDTVGDVVTRYMSVLARLGPSETTQAKVRRIIDGFREDHGQRFIADFRFEHIDKIIEKKRAKVVGEKRTTGGIEAARKLRKELMRLFDYAIKLRIRADNPVRQSEKIRVQPSEKSPGYYAWAEADIEKYRATHALGTNARLAMELMLWTGQRRGDAIRLGPNDILEGRVGLIISKTGKGLKLSLAPQLQSAINAVSAIPGAKSFLINSHGKPYTNPGFGNKMREWCDEAGLPKCTAHGLRKAMMRRLAELNMPNRTMKSVSGHSGDDEVSTYTESANQMQLADEAIAAVSRWEMANRSSLTDGDNRGSR